MAGNPGDFTTVEAVVAFLQTNPNFPIPQADQDDETGLINVLISAASQFVRDYTSNAILNASYTEMRDGVGYEVSHPTFVFAQKPATSVQLVTVAGQTIPPSPAPTPTNPFQAGYMFSATKLVIFGYWVPRIPLCVQLQYTAGYNTVPTDLDHACVLMVAYEYRERRRLGISSEEAAGVGSRTYSIKSIPDRSREIINKYVRVAPVSAFVPLVIP
jgi:hypothetical protein